MIDFSFFDPRLLFPDITESFARLLESFSTAWYFISFVLVMIGEWKLFKKFGEKPWKSLVPYYSTYIMYKNTWNGHVFWIYLFSSTLFKIGQSTAKSLAQRFPNSEWMTIVTLIALPLGIIAAICSILYALRLAEAFGKGKLFCIGLILIYPIFIAILGFGRFKYVSPHGEGRSDGVKEKPSRNRR